MTCNKEARIAELETKLAYIIGALRGANAQVRRYATRDEWDEEIIDACNNVDDNVIPQARALLLDNKPEGL